jgi:adenylate cyclase
MERRLSAILAADVVGYSRLMGADEAGTLDELKRVRRDVIDTNIAAQKGRIVKLTGDGVLAEFPSVVNAVACAAEMQRQMRKRAGASPADRVMQLRIGINLGDVIVEGSDIYGDGVNVAARLEGIAEPGGICVSQSVCDQVGNRLSVTFKDRGEQPLKNIETPVRVFDVQLDEASGTDLTQMMRDDRPSIAVLPFNNMSDDPEQEYFSDGITEDIITDLSKVSGLYVAARNSAFVYKGKAANVQQVGRDLKVRYVVDGSDTATGGHIWGERYDRELTDIFAIQDEITHAIVEQLKVKLLPLEKKSITQPPTDSIEAYNYYLKGRELLRRGSISGYRKGREMFTKATELDRNYARAYAGIADCDSFLYLRTTNERVPPDSILSMADRALALEPGLAEAHASRGAALAVLKRYDEAATEFEKAISLDPNSYEAYWFYARSCIFQAKLEEAAKWLERASEAKEDDYSSVCILPQLYRSLGRPDDVRKASIKGAKLAERQLILHPDDAKAAELGAPCLIELGEFDRAREWLARALSLEPNNPPTQYNAACGYAQLGEIDKAFELLQRGLKTGGPEWGLWIRSDSSLDPLRNDPRFSQLLEDIRRHDAEEL